MPVPAQRRSASGAGPEVVVVRGDAATAAAAVTAYARSGWLTTAACEIADETWELRVVPRD